MLFKLYTSYILVSGCAELYTVKLHCAHNAVNMYSTKQGVVSHGYSAKLSVFLFSCHKSNCLFGELYTEAY